MVPAIVPAPAGGANSPTVVPVVGTGAGAVESESAGRAIGALSRVPNTAAAACADMGGVLGMAGAGAGAGTGAGVGGTGGCCSGGCDAPIDGEVCAATVTTAGARAGNTAAAGASVFAVVAMSATGRMGPAALTAPLLLPLALALALLPMLLLTLWLLPSTAAAASVEAAGREGEGSEVKKRWEALLVAATRETAAGSVVGCGGGCGLCSGAVMGVGGRGVGVAATVRPRLRAQCLW